MGKLTLLLVVWLNWLQYSLWLGKNGVYDLVSIACDITEQQNNNSKLKARNDQLFAKISNLNDDQETIEERSRNELGMIKAGEVFYRLVSKKSK